ncbi:tRNA pseudouridine(55) synthase TruB [Candidatus Sumerlaeota bacterium]|nr:tRNA pseudouridine(55) synthase TruB [Candidatus Sumerlaeota bacterium]
MIHGFLLIDKHEGPTSHDVVARVRRAARQKRVGHSGTLDPAASGLLIIGLGFATKIFEYMDGLRKTYRTTGRLGAASTTDDRQGEIQELPDAPQVSREQIERAIEAFRGEIEQRVPAYSAVQIGGKRLYQLARKGKPVERPIRRTFVERLELLRFAMPEFELEAEVSTGTYIRSLVRDLGEALGSAAYCLSIRRTTIGPFSVDRAVTLDALSPDNPDALHTALIPPDTFVRQLHYPVIGLNEEQAHSIQHGNPVMLDAGQTQKVTIPEDHCFLLNPENKLIAVGMLSSSGLEQYIVSPCKVIPQNMT